MHYATYLVCFHHVPKVPNCSNIPTAIFLIAFNVRADILCSKTACSFASKMANVNCPPFYWLMFLSPSLRDQALARVSKPVANFILYYWQTSCYVNNSAHYKLFHFRHFSLWQFSVQLPLLQLWLQVILVTCITCIILYQSCSRFLYQNLFIQANYYTVEYCL